MTARPTGLQLYGEVHQFLAAKSVQQSEFCRRTGITTALLANIKVASAPRIETVDRVRTALSLWPNVTPSKLRECSPSKPFRRNSVAYEPDPTTTLASAPYPSSRVDRDPCPRCGVRRDIGCSHAARAVSSRI